MNEGIRLPVALFDQISRILMQKYLDFGFLVVLFMDIIN